MKRINNFDKFVIAIIILFTVLLAFVLLREDAVMSGRLEVTIEIADYTESTVEAAKDAENVYLNSVNKPLKTESVTVRDNKLLVTLSGPGETSGDKYIFNGQKILLNQKAEIHATYFAQGKISEIKDADQD